MCQVSSGNRKQVSDGPESVNRYPDCSKFGLDIVAKIGIIHVSLMQIFYAR